MNRGMKVNSIIFRETGTFNDVAARPYEADINAESMVRFDEATRGGTIFSAESLAGIAGTLITPRGQHEGIVEIDHGFQKPRFRFLMEIEHGGAMGGGHRQVLVGYTDRIGADISHSGSQVHLDPSMRLYINSVLTLREVAHDTPGGRQNVRTVFDNSHILSGDFKPSIRRNEGVTPVRMRPEDVLANMTFSEKRLSGGMADFGVTEIHDLRATFADGLCKSRRSNSTATGFLSTVLGARKKAVDKASVSQGDRFSMIESSRGFAQENMISDDMFLGPLARESSLRSGSSLELRELMDMFPYLDDVTDVAMAERLHRDSVMPHQAGESEVWTGSDRATVVATALCHSVPSIMMDLMITRVEFDSTNRTRTGQMRTDITGGRMFMKGIDPKPYMQTFIDRLEVEILKDLTRFGRSDFDISMKSNVFGETSVELSIDGSKYDRFVLPSFCDALFVPVIGRDMSHLSALAADVSEVTDMVRSSMSVSLARDERERDNSFSNKNANDYSRSSV